MTPKAQQTFAAIAPFAVWMALLMALPAKAEMYAVRTVAVALLMLGLALAFRPWREAIRRFRPSVWGLAVGFLVLVIWIFPEQFEIYRRFCIIGDPSTVEVDHGSDLLIGLQLFGSAFVIAPAEEVFYRYFLYRWLDRQAGHWTESSGSRFDPSAFLWTVGLFAVGHNRIVVGAIAGALYGLLAIRKGLGASILAHVTTNLALGLYVLKTGSWQFW